MPIQDNIKKRRILKTKLIMHYALTLKFLGRRKAGGDLLIGPARRAVGALAEIRE